MRVGEKQSGCEFNPSELMKGRIGRTFGPGASGSPHAVYMLRCGGHHSSEKIKDALVGIITEQINHALQLVSFEHKM